MAKSKAHLVKGSAAAKAYMKKLRGMQGGKKKKPGKAPSTNPSPGGGTTTKRTMKYPSVSGVAILGGGAMVATGIGMDHWARIQGRAQTMVDEVGISFAVTGGTIAGVLIIMKLLSSAFPNLIGKRWRGFLRGYKLRP